jgi:hypothetical protein
VLRSGMYRDKLSVSLCVFRARTLQLFNM